MENAGRITFFIITYTSSVAQPNFILMILLINQWYLESQKRHIIHALKNERDVSNKVKIPKIMLD